MDENSILFNYEKAMAQAARLDEIAVKLDRDRRSTEESVSLTVAGWQADSGALFRKKGARLSDGIRESAADVRRLAETVREISRRIRDLEMANLRLIQARDYH